MSDIDNATIEALLNNADDFIGSAVAVLRQAASGAPGDEFAGFRNLCESAAGRLAEVTTSHARAALAEALRPKGPPVMLEWRGDYGAKSAPRTAEFVRTTKTQAVLLIGRNEERFRLDTGDSVRRLPRYGGGRWRIPQSELARIATFEKEQRA